MVLVTSDPRNILGPSTLKRNAIYNAARFGVSLNGATCYVNWFPCIDCARAIVQAGIMRLVGLEPDRTDKRWGAEFVFALDMFAEVGLELALFDLPEAAARG